MALLRDFCYRNDVVALWDTPMSDHTSFRIGGPADALLMPDSEKKLIDSVAFLRREKIPYRLIGNGTNLLVSDAGFRGAIVCTRHIRSVSAVGCTVRASTGTPLNVLCRTLADLSLGGMESVYGIPGTVGGALVMNAGAFGGEISDALQFVSVFHPETGRIETVRASEAGFAYRKSIFKESPFAPILSAEFLLCYRNTEKIREKMKQILKCRMEKQPTALPSAGSTFLRPSVGYAAQWIEEAGLRGYRVGGAAVSIKHTGFIVNLGGATARDVLCLIEKIRDTVEKRFGVLLTPEIEYIEERSHDLFE